MSIDSNLGVLAKQAVQSLNFYLSRYQENPLLLLFSGGSALKIVEELDPTLLNKNATISVLDERFTLDPKINIFAQLSQSSLYQKLNIHTLSCIDTRPNDGETLESLAQRFELELKKWRQQNMNGQIICTQGMGADGHTAGIMPFPEDSVTFNTLFNTENRWVIGYDAKGKNEHPLRVTTTLPFLKLINHSIMYITGEDKKNMLKRALEPSTVLSEVPAAIIQQMKHVHIFTDCDFR